MSLSVYFLILIFLIVTPEYAWSRKGCLDKDGNMAGNGLLFHPEVKDPCKECFCNDGSPEGCATAWCAPPECDWKKIEGECCKFECRPSLSWFDWIFGRGNDDDEVELDGTACVDGYGKNVKKGDRYIPFNFEDCLMCTCNAGPEDCVRVKCVPPDCPLWEKVKDECCKFKCLEG